MGFSYQPSQEIFNKRPGCGGNINLEGILSKAEKKGAPFLGISYGI
jgi:hypothetical protein